MKRLAIGADTTETVIPSALYERLLRTAAFYPKRLDEVEKINDVVGYDDQFLIAPWSDDSTLREDESGEMLEAKEVLLNVPRHSGNYIEVPVVIGE